VNDVSRNLKNRGKKETVVRRDGRDERDERYEREERISRGRTNEERKRRDSLPILWQQSIVASHLSDTEKLLQVVLLVLQVHLLPIFLHRN
jgi:hypothetical protein